MKTVKLVTTLLVFIGLTACQTKLATKDRSVPPKTQLPKQIDVSPPVIQSNNDKSEVESETEALSNNSETEIKVKKLGLILGPGGMKTFAYPAFLQELAKQKVPVTAITGIEFGALSAALFSQKAQGFDVEWQLFKIKEEDLVEKGLLSSSNKNAGDLSGFFRDSFVQRSIENSKIPFACASFNKESQRTSVLSKGLFEVVLPFCLGLPPALEPYKKSTAAPFSVKQLADFLRSKGADYVVFVNVLSQNSDSRENKIDLLWSFISGELSNQRSSVLAGIDLIVNIPVPEVGITEFNKRRLALQKGQNVSVDAVKKIADTLGL